jgi:zinc protease
MLDRRTPPPFVHSTSFNLIDPIHSRLNNGIDLYFISGGSQEVIKIEMMFRAGRWYENHTGASQFAANLLSKGTSTKNSYQIAQMFDRYGAHVEINPGFDFVSVCVYTVTQYLAPVLDVFIDIMADPAFPDKELEQHKNIFLQNLKVNEEKTSFLASKAFRKKLFGEDHPYGREVEESDVNRLFTSHLHDHFRAFYRKPIGLVSGKISQSDRELLTRCFEKLQGGAVPQRSAEPRPDLFFRESITKEGAVQSSIRTGKKSILRSHPRYAEVIFALHILGGYFGSRLMKNIREEKGLTYGIYASLQPLQSESFILIGADVNRENVDLTLEEIHKELRILREENVSETELETAKNHFIGSLRSEITTPFAHADKIKTVILSKLPSDFYQNLIHTVNDMTPEMVRDISAEYLHEDTFSSISVG